MKTSASCLSARRASRLSCEKKPSSDNGSISFRMMCFSWSSPNSRLHHDGRSIAVPIGWYPRLSHATPVERDNFEISGAGYGIHWPDLDEDIGVEGMLLGKKSAESAESLGRWLAGRVKP